MIFLIVHDTTQVTTTSILTGIDGTLAAVDSTKEKALGEKYKVKGFPTGKFVVFDVKHLPLVKFLKVSDL